MNQSYRGQRVTGQQRYAAEIGDRLLAGPGFSPVAPGGFWGADTKRTWAWLQFVLPWRLGRDLLVSMTSRAPLWRRRHVLVVHDLFVLTNPEWFSASYHRTHAPLLRAQLRSAAAVVAVSRPTADQLARFHPGPIVVAPNAPSAVFAPSGSTGPELANLSGLEGLRPGEYLLAVGNQEPRKNLARLAQAYGRLDPGVRAAHPLVVVGAGNAIYQSERIDWPEGTLLAGYVTDPELAVLYRHARALVLVSLAEGFGLPLIEAAAAGTRQLVLSDLEVFRWICGDEAHYVDPLDPASIADGLRAALTEPRHQQIELGRFDWDASAETIRAVCLELAAR